MNGNRGDAIETFSTESRICYICLKITAIAQNLSPHLDIALIEAYFSYEVQYTFLLSLRVI